jgi:hypothetical protein
MERKKMTEPIAWRATDRGKTLLTDDTEFILKMWKHNGFKIEPLYLLRELTDREIMELYCLTSDNDPLDFARAILKKASEK